MPSKMNESDYIFYISTPRANNLKKLFEVLKEKMIEAVIHINKEKMAAFHVEERTNEILSLSLESKNFEKYISNQDYVLYFEPITLYPTVKQINNDNTMSLYVLKDKPHKLFIFTQSNTFADEYSRKEFDLLQFPDGPPKLATISKGIKPVLSIEFPSKRLNGIFKDIHNLNSIYIDIKILQESIDLENSKSQIVFSSYSTTLSNNETFIGEAPDGSNPFEVTQGSFRLGSIKSFVKGLNANNTEQTDLVLHMGYNFIIISYDISTLGKIQLIIESVHPEEIFNREETFNYRPDWNYILKRMPLESDYIKNIITVAKKDPKNKYRISKVNEFIELVEKYRPEILE